MSLPNTHLMKVLKNRTLFLDCLRFPVSYMFYTTITGLIHLSCLYVLFRIRRCSGLRGRN